MTCNELAEHVCSWPVVSNGGSLLMGHYGLWSSTTRLQRVWPHLSPDAASDVALSQCSLSCLTLTFFVCIHSIRRLIPSFPLSASPLVFLCLRTRRSRFYWFVAPAGLVILMLLTDLHLALPLLHCHTFFLFYSLDSQAPPNVTHTHRHTLSNILIQEIFNPLI